MKLILLERELSVIKLMSKSELPESAEIVFFAITPDEISLVCDTISAPADCVAREDGWRALRVSGVLDFSLIGILAELTRVLAEAKVGVFCVSTYDTDYILIKSRDLERASAALIAAGHEITA